MHVEQAIFTSANGGSMKGYQLVSRSRGIDRCLAQQLCRWAPSHASLWGDQPHAWSLNYFPAGDDWVAITRTLYGGPEYSDRGGTRVVTAMLAVRAQQLAGYQYNPVSLARTAMALGQLRLVIDPAECLPTVLLPDFPLLPSFQANTDGASPGGAMAEIRQRLLDDQRVAVEDVGDPVSALASLFESVPIHRRVELSFTTGLRPSAQRAFRLHILPSLDAATCRTLQSQGVLCVSPVGALSHS